MYALAFSEREAASLGLLALALSQDLGGWGVKPGSTSLLCAGEVYSRRVPHSQQGHKCKAAH